MIQKAIEKIREEMQKSNNSYIQAIGDFLLKQLEINIGAAAAIMQEGKTIKSSLEEVTKIAKAKAVNGCVIMADTEVFDIVQNYFGIEAIQEPKLGQNIISLNEYKKADVKKESDLDDLNLDDLF